MHDLNELSREQNLSFDALLNADSIPMLRGTQHNCNAGSEDVRFDNVYQQIGHEHRNNDRPP
jgi:hypothetical protein